MSGYALHIPKRASWRPSRPGARPSIGWLSRLPEWMAYYTTDRIQMTRIPVRWKSVPFDGWSCGALVGML